MECGRCGGAIATGHEEGCWWCNENLCSACWNAHGHCGHPEADQANQRAREVGSHRAYDELVRGRAPSLEDVEIIAESPPYIPSDEDTH